MFGIDDVAWAGFLGKAKKIVTSKWFIVGIGALAIAFGTYAYLNHSRNQAVEDAVSGANAAATIQTYETKDVIDRRTAPIDERYNKLRDQTTKDYANARNSVKNRSANERNAQAPSILIDTVNELDRMRSIREDGDKG